MAYIGFNDRGYEYFNEGYHLLFSENNSHELLFNYVVQDLSCLSELFDQYISQRMDTTTFKVHDDPGDDTSIDQMKEILINAHPYYKYEIREVLIKAIGNYFNKLLLFSCFFLKTINSEFPEEWYMKRIIALLNPFLQSWDTSPKDFYNEYQKITCNDIYIDSLPEEEMDTFIFGVPRKMPTGFSDEIITQREIYNMLYFLLDIAAPELDTLTTPQRMWLYGNISNTEVTIPKLYSLDYPTLYRSSDDDNHVIAYRYEVANKFNPFHFLADLNVGRDGVPTDIEKDFRSIIDYAKEAATTESYEIYKISSLRQLLYLEVWTMTQNKVKIRKCRHCGKYFVAATRRIVYCDRVDESGIRCSAVGYQESFQKKLEDDKPLQIYNRAYKTHHARVRKGTMTKDAFQLWCIEAKRKMEKARSGELDIAQFQEWSKK